MISNNVIYFQEDARRLAGNLYRMNSNGTDKLKILEQDGPIKIDVEESIFFTRGSITLLGK